MWRRKAPWQWTPEEHRQAFEAHMAAEGLRLMREQEALDRSYLLPPGGLGYGRVGRWPFDIEKAQTQPGYSRGINRAIDNPHFHPLWRTRAQEDMDNHVRPYLQQMVDDLYRVSYELERVPGENFQ